MKRKNNRLKPHDVTYNSQVILSSSSVKFLGITFDSALTFRSHFRTVATLARHRVLKLNYIFSSTYGPSTITLIRLYKSYIRSLFDYGAPAICVASPDIQLIWERIQTQFISRALSIPFFIHNDRKRQHAYLPPIHDRNLYLAKRCNTMQHNVKRCNTTTRQHRQSHPRQTQHSRCCKSIRQLQTDKSP